MIVKVTKLPFLPNNFEYKPPVSGIRFFKLSSDANSGNAFPRTKFLLAYFVECHLGNIPVTSDKFGSVSGLRRIVI